MAAPTNEACRKKRNISILRCGKTVLGIVQVRADRKRQVDTLLEEFKALRNEIDQRSDAQLRLIQLNITAIGIILGAFFTPVLENDPRILFLIPVVSPILGLLWLDHATAIRHLGMFIQNKLKPALFERVGGRLPDYEQFVRGLELRRFERGLLAWPIVLMFAVIPGGTLFAPLFVSSLKELREEFLLFSVPGIVLIALLSWVWLRFWWIRNTHRSARASRR
jgi:hypothetical protein